MERADRPNLLALGFEQAELAELGLWDVVTGPPADLAEAYIRRSDKRDDVISLRQHARDIVRAARVDGVRIRHVWFEQKSASKAYVRREEFEGATDAVLRGISRSLYVWKTDRLSRRGMGQVGLLLDEFDRRQAGLVSVIEGLDSRKGSRIVFAILSEQARDEAKNTSLRVKIGVDSHKAEGHWSGGVAPYGLHSPKGSKRLEPLVSEYGPSRRIALLLLDAVTPQRVADAVNADGLTRRNGKPWNAGAIISLAHSPAWAGLLADRKRMTDEHGMPAAGYHRGGEPFMGADGHPVTCGEGVITYAERVKILRLLAGRSTPGSSYGSRVRGKRQHKSLLTELAGCPHCRVPMTNAGVSYYCRTRKEQGQGACPGIATDRTRLDAAVSGLWMTHILALPPDSPTIQNIARRWLSYQDPTRDLRKEQVRTALEEAEARADKLDDRFYVKGAMSEQRYDTLSTDLRQQIQQMSAELMELDRDADLSPLMDPESLTALWGSAGVEDRRALLAAALIRVTVMPPRYRGDRTPILERLVPEWRDPATTADTEAAYAAAARTRKRKAKLSPTTLQKAA